MNNEYDQAVALFQKVIDKDPEDYDSNLNVGNAYLSMADEYRKSLVARENNGEEIKSEETEKMKEYFAKTIPYLEKAVSLRPEDDNVWNNLGIAYIQAGNLEKGKECFDKAEELRK